jgi:tetratricopeptide (TPR) repeat protein
MATEFVNKNGLIALLGNAPRRVVFAAPWAAMLALLVLRGTGVFGASAVDRAQTAYQQARKAAQQNAGDNAKAIELAHATFDLAEFAKSDTERAALAQEGITAARKAVESQPNVAGGHYYLAMNLGQLARTKSLGALRLVREMEQEFLKARELDAKLDFGGPDRSLGQLYRDAPGWPTSIGNKGKARAHLLKAVEIDPEFPDNQLSLMEAYLNWRERLPLRNLVARYRSEILPKAKQRFAGEKWEAAWEDWNKSFQELAAKAQKMEADGRRGAE